MKRGIAWILAAAALLAAACGGNGIPASGAQAGTLATPATAPTPTPTSAPATVQPTVAPVPVATAVATPAPGIAPGMAGTGAADPIAAVRALLPSPGAATACRPPSGAAFSAAAGCPVTQRLEQRLRANPTGGSAGGADPICRCQNVPATVPVTLETPGGTSALVRASFAFSASPPDDVRFVVLSQGGRWFVDDTYCADPSTSIYVSPVRGCS
jgi:hypothetical protein